MAQLDKARGGNLLLVKMKALRIIAASLFVICFPLLLLTSNLRVEVGAIQLYEYGFEKYDISERTGLDNAELAKAAEGLIEYFNTSKESARMQVVKDGEEIELFSQREIDHLTDVKNLIRMFYAIQWITLAYALIYIAAGFITHKRAFLRQLTQVVFFGGAFTLGLFVLVGIWAVIDFDSLFLNFHLTSFSNDLWILDPTKDYLIMMFPEGFFLDAALFLVGSTVVEALILGGGAWVYRRWRLTMHKSSRGIVAASNALV